MAVCVDYLCRQCLQHRIDADTAQSGMPVQVSAVSCARKHANPQLLSDAHCRRTLACAHTEVRMFSAKQYEITRFEAANGAAGHDFKLSPVDVQLTTDTVDLARNADVVCIFVNDTADREVLQQLADSGTKCLAVRAAGFNNIDLAAAQELGIKVVRVPSYSPNAVAEHTLALILALNRNIHRGYNRVRDRNFALHGLVGFDLKGATYKSLHSVHVHCKCKSVHSVHVRSRDHTALTTSVARAFYASSSG